MATQSTAIVNLLDLVRNKALPKDAGDDDLFGGMARFDATAMPVPARLIAPLPTLPQARPGGANFDYQPTVRVQRSRNYIALVKKAAVPTGLFVVAMVLLSIYLAKDGKPPATAVAARPAAKVAKLAPTPPAKPVVTPIVTPIEEAKSTPIVTPIVTPIEEPTVPAAPTTVPAAAPPAAAPSEQAPATVAAAPARTVKAGKHSRTRDRRAAKRAKVKKQREARVAVVEKAEKPARSAKGFGTLSISSSSPRELWIDGRNTKELTPQRVVLAPGPHNVTLVDSATRKAKTFQVEIAAKKTTTVSK